MEWVSTISAKGRTTVPKPVRDALGVGPGGKIVFRVEEGRISIRRADRDEDDPVVSVFLSFLAEDMQNHPGRLTTLSLALAERIAVLIEDVDVDPGAAIEGSVAF